MIKPTANIQNTPPAHHGAFDYDELARLGLSADEVIDFSVNSNPYGPPPGVREAIARVPLERYPDRECLALRQRLAALHGVSINHIVIGNGTAELLLLIAMAYLQPKDNVLTVSPTFSEYERVARLMGANVTTLDLLPMHGFQPTYSDIAGAIGRTQARLVFLCHPNNPTGLPLDVQRTGGLIDTFPETLFVVDEAYIRFTSNVMSVYEHSYGYPNVVVLRSLTKDYALAGLRLGYALGHPDIVESIRRVRPAWNVNALAQAAGIAVLNSGRWLTQTIAQLHDDKQNLINGLRDLGLPPLESAAHYCLVKVGDGAAFRSKLLTHKLMVRDCASFGLPEYIRIATRTPQDNQRLLHAIEKILT